MNQPLVGPEGDATGTIIFDRRASLEAARTLDPLPPVLAIVVTAAVGRWLAVEDPEKYRPFSLGELDERWRECQRELVRRCGGLQILARTAGHRLDVEAPDLVALAVASVVTAVQRGEGLAVDVGRLAAAGGDLVDTLNEDGSEPPYRKKRALQHSVRVVPASSCRISLRWATHTEWPLAAMLCAHDVPLFVA